jgi:hypothetical protein
LIVILAVITFLATSPVAAQQPFSFYNQSSYLDETKILHVLGEVRNDSDEIVKEIVVTATFYDSQGDGLGEFRRTVEYQVMRPGESSPFEILYLDQKTSDKVANFTLSATAAHAEKAKDLRLKIVSSNSRLDLLGTFYLNALARNEGSETSTNTLLIATLYDSNNRVIAIGRALAEAVRGTADVPAGSEAPFGVVIADKSQTYNAARYTLVAQSDQYMSEEVLFRTTGAGQTSSGGNQTQSGCLIATAAFGSELAPQVQQLREFRDNIALKTFAGSSFMNAFNAWYYSFSPSVAEYERSSSWAREAVQGAIQPLLMILDASKSLHSTLSFLGMNSESAVIVTGMMASSLIGLFYLSPVAVLIGIKKKQFLDIRRVKIILMSCWVVSGILLAVGALSMYSEPMTAGTSMLVLCSMSTATLFLSDRISRL